MKTLSLITSALALSAMMALSGCGGAEPKAPEATTTEVAKAPAKSAHVEKMGFFTVEKCAVAGEFLDCRLENYACGSDGCYRDIQPTDKKPVQLALFSHNDGKVYKLIMTKDIKIGTIDKNINRNDVSVIGELDEATDTIVVTELKGPPPPKKSFFKGCL